MLKREDLVYPELSYRIIGCAYDVFNEIGGGHKETVYQQALGIALKDAGLASTGQHYYPVKYKDKIVGKNFFDFFIDEKILIEIKAADRFSKAN